MPNEKNDKLDTAIDRAEKMLGMEISDRAREKLRDPQKLSQLLKSLSKDDINLISSAIKNPEMLNKLSKDKNITDKIKEKLGD